MALSGTLDRFVHIYYVHLLSFQLGTLFLVSGFSYFLASVSALFTTFLYKDFSAQLLKGPLELFIH